MARRYALNLNSAMWEPDVVLSAQQLSELDQSLEPHEARWMNCEDVSDKEMPELLNGRGIQSAVFMTLGVTYKVQMTNSMRPCYLAA
jgi:hypothetical protein